MKKIVMTAALAIASFGAFAANTATNTIALTVPQILSITANPEAIAYTLSETEMFSSPTWDVNFNIRSNDAYTSSSTVSVTLHTANASNATEKQQSLATYASKMKIRVSDDVLAPFAALSGLGNATVTGENTQDLSMNWTPGTFIPGGTHPHTTNAGRNYTMRAKLDQAGMDLIPGTYTLTIATTVSQP